MLVDTNILVDLLRNYPPAVHFFSEPFETRLCFSAITETELLRGHANNDARKREDLLHILSSMEKIDITNPVALLAGDLARTHAMDVPDAIIASTALLNDQELITRNLKDFQKIPHLRVRSPY